jgi:tRNA U34 5-methylaminomethyl-2-thiouridine-forming methyltransferase MnmC
MSGGYQLIQLKNGSWSVRSIAEGETFHPVVGPVAEAEALYVRQLRLADRAAGSGEPFVLWDIGLGAAANVLTALRALRETARRVEVVSFDHTLAPLEFALANATALGYVEGFELAIQTLLEQRSVEFTQGPMTVSWQVVEGDFPTVASEAGATSWPAPHGILFDAFSPARNPAMWTLSVFRRLRQLAVADRPCALATYSRATLVRVTLLLAGWHVGVGHATGEKDETTVAANRPDLITEPLDREWLWRARRSTSAEPLHTPQYCQQPLSEPSWEALLRLPQFQPLDPTVDPDPDRPPTGPAFPG